MSGFGSPDERVIKECQAIRFRWGCGVQSRECGLGEAESNLNVRLHIAERSSEEGDNHVAAEWYASVSSWTRVNVLRP